jgi:DNA-binding CsgD family transcriptional regulator
MEHISLLYWIISFSIGFTTQIIVFLIYLKDKSPILKAYLLFMFFFSVLVITSGLKRYSDINLPFISSQISFYLDIISITAESFIIILCPLFAHSLLKKSPPAWRLFVFTAWAIIIFSIMNISFLFFIEVFPIVNTVFITSIFLVSVYAIAIVVLDFKQIKSKSIRRYIISLLIMGLFVTATFIFDFIINFEQKSAFVTSSFRVGVAIYLIWSLLTMFYAIKHYFDIPKEIHQKLDELAAKYDISKREIEVISLIINGLSNKQIAYKLFISTGTVKRHVHNIFEKTNTKSRIELINLLSI